MSQCPDCHGWVDETIIHACPPTSAPTAKFALNPLASIGPYSGKDDWVSYKVQYGVSTMANPAGANSSIQSIQSPPAVTKTVYSKSSTGVTCTTYYSDGTSDTETVHAPVSEPPVDRPRPRRAFPDEMADPAHWSYVVERRTKNSLMETTWWGDWKNADQSFWPVGFSTRPAAQRRMLDCQAKDAHNLGLGVAEFRVTPKYLGHRPTGESWYSAEYPPPSTQ